MKNILAFKIIYKKSCVNVSRMSCITDLTHQTLKEKLNRS